MGGVGSTHAVQRPEVQLPTRYRRELTVRTRDASDDIRARQPKDTVSAVQRALKAGDPKAQAARRLQSGDTVLTFEGDTEIIARRTDWVQAAFGPGVRLHRKLYNVIAKGVPIRWTKGDGYTDLIAEVKKSNGVEVIKAVWMNSKVEGKMRATFILSVDGAETANLLCDNGMILEAEILNCEPYDESIRPRQCYGYSPLDISCGTVIHPQSAVSAEPGHTHEG